jgi:branched-subunit amino acid ABC-type transport system permease component
VQEIIFFLLLGLGIGSLYAMLGAGLVVIYKGSGVINFAHGAMAMYGVFTFDTAWNRGELFLPWVDFLPTHDINMPVRITLSDSGSVPMVVALILALAMAAFIGWAAHTLIFRPLRNAAPLGKVVASLGLALYLQGVALLNFGNSFPVPKSVFPDSSIENFLGLGRTFPAITLYATAAAIILGGGLWALFSFTRFGLATRAAASNEKGAILLGYSPDRLAKINWILASLLATTSAIILGPLQGAITPVGLTALIVPALAAALIGGLRSIPVAVAGGFGVGAVQTLLQSKQQDWFPPILENGIPQTLPLVVIVVVLVWRGKSLPVRGSVEEKRLPLAPMPKRVYQHAAVWGTVAIFLAYVFENSGSTTIMGNALQQTLVFAVIMLSMVVLTGYVGQISLAQMSLAGISAFMMARMMANGEPSGSNLVPVPGPDFPWPIAAIIGIAAAVVVGLLIGLPALRIRGVQLAVVTLAAAVAIQSLLLENEEITELRAGVPAFVNTPTFFGIDIGARSLRQQNERPAFVIFAVIVLALVAIAITNMRRSGVGRRFLAVRANERAAAASGINVPRTKLLAFGISAGIAGIGGVMLAFKQVEVSSANFPYLASLVVLAFAYLGGITSINGGIVAGALTAGALVPITSNYFFAETNIERYVGMLGGLGLIVTAIIHPEGIAPFFSGMMRHLGNWLCTAIPGATTLKNAYAPGSRTRSELSVIYLVLLIGSALFLYHVPIEPNVVRALVWLALLWVIAMALSLRYGGLSPSFAQAGAVWIDWAKRFGPAALAGYVIGWLIWPIRVDTYSMLWMPLLGAGLGLFIRANYRMIRYGRVHLDGSSHDDHDPEVVDLRPTDETAEMAEVR